MHGIPKNKRKITPKIAMQILAEHGVTISHHEAEMVLDMMYDFAKLAFNQQLQQPLKDRISRFTILDQDK